MAENHGGTRVFPCEQQKGRCSKENWVLQAEAQSRLRKSGYHELHSVSCDFHKGFLTLRGRVSSFHLKQVAQDVIRRLDGAEEVNNRQGVAAPP
jgi:osmotically-inducible protein OsmY